MDFGQISDLLGTEDYSLMASEKLRIFQISTAIIKFVGSIKSLSWKK